MREVKYKIFLLTANIAPMSPGIEIHEMINVFSKTRAGIANDGKNVFLQYIGLKDKNGKEIYEGDRIRITDEHGNEDSGVVEYITERAAYGFRYREDSNRILDPSTKDVIDNLGSIYENRI